MTQSEFTDLAEAIFDDAKQKLPVAIKSRVVCDKSSTADKREKRFEQETLKFCIWSSPTAGFWDRDYGSYHIIYDPRKELSEEAIFQVRFMFFTKRKQTGSGRFNSDVWHSLQPFDGQQGFKLSQGPKHIDFQKLYYIPCQSKAWLNEATEDLAWMLAETWPQFERIIIANPLS